MATNGFNSFVIFLYADNGIQWTTGDASDGSNGFGGTPAQVGFNAGDGIRFAVVPASRTADIVNIEETSNVGTPGIWIYRVDQNTIISADECSTDPGVDLFLSPRFGSQLGGTAIRVSGPCIEISDTVTCSFDGTETSAVYINRFEVLCVSPLFSTVGRIAVSITIIGEDKEIKYQGVASFFSIHPDRAHGVDVESSIFLDQYGLISLEWNPSNILPLVDASSFRVDALIYWLDNEDGVYQWVQHSAPLRTGLQNSGRAENLNLPKFGNKFDIIPMYIEVVVGVRSNGAADEDKEVLASISEAHFPVRPGIWTGLLFSTLVNKRLPDRSRNNKLQDRCTEWQQDETQNIPDEVITSLPPCPPTRDRATLANSGLVEERRTSLLFQTNYHNQWLAHFHSGAARCLIQSGAESGRTGQQCCYNEEGDLIVNSPSGGSVNRFAPVDLVSFYQHVQHDILPNLYCCPRYCPAYYQRRPSDTGERYQPPPPACVYGDPHVITLDGLRYTFNGKGEFTLIETQDNLFTLQGRMVVAEGALGASAPATVFSGIAGKQGNSDTVEFKLNSEGGINTVVNGQVVDFDGMDEQSFVNVTVMDKGNNTYSATFTSGAYIEVRATNQIISLLLVSLPPMFINITKGLMGSYNGDTSDDLVPRIGDGVGEPISINSSLEDIHTQFGITWIIDQPEESLFTYTAGESWASFYDPNFTPSFSTTFDDPELEQQAQDICGDDEFCRFDIAATKRPEIGLTTAINTQEFDIISNMSAPIECTPTCENGVCVATNTCHCAEGYIGDSCSVAVLTECDENPCQNGGLCHILAGSFMCTCPPEFTGVSCTNLLPPKVVNDTVADTPLFSVPLRINPALLGFTDYRDLISLCYEIQGSPRDTVNLVSTDYTSIAAHYSTAHRNNPQTLIDAIGIRSADSEGDCHNIRVNQDCKVFYDNQQVMNNLTSHNISIKESERNVIVVVPNNGKQISVEAQCKSTFIRRLSTKTMSITIARGFAGKELSHGLIGQFWSSPVSVEPYIGSTVGLTPGYPPYTVTVGDPSTSESLKFVSVLIPRLWNHEAGQCLYAGNSQGGPTGGSPPVSMGSVIQGEYSDYRVRSLHNTEFTYSKFNQHACM